jgi:hypothetical protein
MPTYIPGQTHLHFFLLPTDRIQFKPNTGNLPLFLLGRVLKACLYLPNKKLKNWPQLLIP